MKFETPKMSIAKFAFENVATTASGDALKDSNTYKGAQNALTGDGVEQANVVTVIL